jgi:phage regulator Rha-like protein
MTVGKDTEFVSIEHIAESIIVVRGQRVLLDSNLARMYGVATKRFNEQFKRNLARFPVDFAFQLSDSEAESLRSQFATLKNSGRGQHRKYRPYAFTEHGAIMAAMILNSPRAVEMSVYVVRAFVQLRGKLAADNEIVERITQLEHGHETLTSVVNELVNAFHEQPESPQKRAIGFFDLEEKKKPSSDDDV